MSPIGQRRPSAALERARAATPTASTASTAGIVADNQDPLQIGRLQAMRARGARRGAERLGAAVRAVRRDRRPASSRPAGRRRRLDRVRGRRRVAADLVGRLVGDGRGADGREAGAVARRRRKILRTDFGLIVALDDAAQTITLSDALGAEPHDDQGLEGTIEIQQRRRASCSRRR